MSARRRWLARARLLLDPNDSKLEALSEDETVTDEIRNPDDDGHVHPAADESLASPSRDRDSESDYPDDIAPANKRRPAGDLQRELQPALDELEKQTQRMLRKIAFEAQQETNAKNGT